MARRDIDCEMSGSTCCLALIHKGKKLMVSDRDPPEPLTQWQSAERVVGGASTRARLRDAGLLCRWLTWAIRGQSWGAWTSGAQYPPR